MKRLSRLATRVVTRSSGSWLPWTTAVLAPLLALSAACGGPGIEPGAGGAGGSGTTAMSSGSGTGTSGVGGADGGAKPLYEARWKKGTPTYFVILRRLPDENRCAFLTVYAEDPLVAGVTSVPVNQAVQDGPFGGAGITSDVTDCDSVPEASWMPHGVSVDASGGTGTVKVDATDVLHPTVTIHGSLSVGLGFAPATTSGAGGSAATTSGSTSTGGDFPPPSVKLDAVALPIDH